jgi:hypothetical protein
MVWQGKGVVKAGRVLLGETNPLASLPGTIRGGTYPILVMLSKQVSGTNSSSTDLFLLYRRLCLGCWPQHLPRFRLCGQCREGDQALVPPRRYLPHPRRREVDLRVDCCTNKCEDGPGPFLLTTSSGSTGVGCDEKTPAALALRLRHPIGCTWPALAQGCKCIISRSSSFLSTSIHCFPSIPFQSRLPSCPLPAHPIIYSHRNPLRKQSHVRFRAFILPLFPSSTSERHGLGDGYL